MPIIKLQLIRVEEGGDVKCSQTFLDLELIFKTCLRNREIHTLRVYRFAGFRMW